ncbi:MAG: GGDEF domain-containing protein, partial [Pseudomonadota bacterium]
MFAMTQADPKGSNAAQFLEQVDNSLWVGLQPICSLSNDSVFGYEALSRGWDALGFASPHELFDRAEELDVLAELEFRQTVRAIEMMATRFQPPRPQLFVNLDIRILDQNHGFFDRLGQALETHGLARRDLCMELSERHEKNNAELLRDLIAEQRGAGFRFALDDFGNGVSDVLALYHFDIDVLKIDRFLIDGIAEDSRKRFFVARVVELAHLLGQTVVAEGIETAADLEVCRELQCDLAQGYHLGKATRVPVTPTVTTYRKTVVRTPDNDLSSLAERAPAFRAEAPARTIIQALAEGRTHSFFPVVDDQNRPIGIIREAALSTFLASPFAQDLLQNPSYHKPIGDFVTPCPIADVTVDPDRLLEMVAGASADGVIVTSEMAYLGIIPASRLVALSHESKLRQAMETNPLSRLPGNRAINRFLKTVAEASECRRFVAYLDFDSFKPFNDVYGFQRGDQVIELFAALMRTHFEPSQFFLGHVGGDDFVVG